MPASKYCWDSGVFISLLTGERRATGETEGMFEVADAVDRGDALIVASAVALGEVLRQGGEAAATIRPRFEALFQRPTFLLVTPTPAMYSSAGDLRTAARADGRNLKLPDALHVVTAMAYRCDALHTFDDKLIALSGRTYVGGLRICKPSGTQTVLGLF